MSAARALGTLYLLMASVFGVAIALHQHPDWQRGAVGTEATAVRLADTHLLQPAAAVGMQELTSFFDTIDPKPVADRAEVARNELSSHALRVVPRTALASPPKVVAITVWPTPRLRPALDDKSSPAETRPRLALAAPSVSAQEPVPQPALSSQPSIAPEDLTRVVERLKDNLTPELFANFALFLYVSKAEHGPWAQHMYVFAKADNGDLNLQYDWLVSTGREQVEINDAGRRLTTHTPPGYYELDPERLYRHYHSSEWGKPMPYAMFFDWMKNGRKTGLALHAATGDDIALLGRRASAGCIHLAPKDAATLFTLIKSRYRGLAPRFAVNRRTGTMSNEGILLHDANGRVELAEGYRVLVFVENYGGKDNVIAALY